MVSSLHAWGRMAFSLDLRSLAAFRMAIGAIVCADALLRTRDFSLMFATDGMFPTAVLERHFGDRWAWSLALLVDADWWNAAVLALECIAGALLAVGVRTRWMTVAAWMAVVSVFRRTPLATNAGDFWLCCLLFWGMFLPLGSVWSVDARRLRLRRAQAPAVGQQVASIASAALVLQIAAVYLGAGLSKWNDSWFSGTAVAHALSVHDHGTHLGSLVAAQPMLAKPLTWSVLAVELLTPCLLVAVPTPAVRLAVASVLLLLHAGIALLMSVGLFAYIGMAAWLALLPGSFWEWMARTAPTQVAAASLAANFGEPIRSGPRVPGARAAWRDWLCAACLGVAVVNFLHANTPWRSFPLPAPIRAAIRLTSLEQDWGMFGDVPRQEQWVYGRAELADGRVVDLLRGGRPLEPVRPAGGFLSLPHHRWHKIFWELPKPPLRMFSPSIAAALARNWNRSHAASEQVKTLEIRFARLGDFPAAGTLQELLLASWPPRDGKGRGNLDRWLDERGHHPEE